jgi:hypothetical protein
VGAAYSGTDSFGKRRLTSAAPHIGGGPQGSDPLKNRLTMGSNAAGGSVG